MMDVYEQFVTAVVENDVSEVTRMIESGIDLNYRCDQGAYVPYGPSRFHRFQDRDDLMFAEFALPHRGLLAS